MNQSNQSESTKGQGPANGYWNPYLAGLLLGAILLASFLILGAGLGASAGLARMGASLEACVLPDHTKNSTYFGQYFGDGGTASPLSYYLVFMFVGTLLGGMVSAVLARRVRVAVERGKTFAALPRVLLALAGGLLVGYASRLAGGCTSGQALTGGALLLSGSIVFMLCIFVGGYVTAFFVRGQWHD
jgi:uncharacterized membrane protein YedE/YeeE